MTSLTFLACGACQMTQLTWAFPAFPSLIWCLIPAGIAYLVAIDREGAGAGEKVGLLVLFLGSFFVGLAFLPILVFPLMLLVVPLLLVAKIGSRHPAARVAAVVGLLPFLLVLGKTKWDMMQAGPYYRLDNVTLRQHFARRLGDDPLPELTEDQLVESLVEGPARRRRNAAVLLRGKLHGETDVARLQELLAKVEAVSSPDQPDYVTKLVADLEEAVEEKSPVLDEATVSAARGKAVSAFQTFANELKAELTSAMEKGGPPAAVEVCRLKAPRIAEAVSGEVGFPIGRSSHRLRNPNNRPSEAVKAYLMERSKKPAAKAGVEVVAEGDAIVVIAPIPIQPLCLTCHGDPATFSPELKQALQEHYPLDEATGFKPNELRGAFWARLPRQEQAVPGSLPAQERKIKTH